MSKRFQKTELRAAADPPTADSFSPSPPKTKRSPGAPKVVLDVAEGVSRIDLEANVQGRDPPIKVLQIIRALGQIHATVVDLATVLGVTEQTMHAIFRRQPEVKRIWEIARTDGRISLRRKLIESPAPAVQMFLAKNYLGMCDQLDVKGEISHEHNVLLQLYQKIADGAHGKVIGGEVVPSLPSSGKTIAAD
jgi:hypothetical protein